MKQIILLLCLLILSTASFAKKKKTNPYEFLRNQKQLHLVIDYSNAVIHGLSEDDFLELQAIKGGEEWKTKWEEEIKKELYLKFVGEVNTPLIGKYDLRVANYPDAEYQATIQIQSITQRGTTKAKVVFTKRNSNEEITYLYIDGLGGTFGSKENLMGDGFRRAGEDLGGFLYYRLRKLKL